jgi:hypothetical protein
MPEPVEWLSGFSVAPYEAPVPALAYANGVIAVIAAAAAIGSRSRLEVFMWFPFFLRSTLKRLKRVSSFGGSFERRS